MTVRYASTWQGMCFFSGTFGPLIFIFCSGKTLSGATQGLASHWLNSTVLRAATVKNRSQHFGRLPTMLTPSSVSNIGFLTATCWMKKKSLPKAPKQFFPFFPGPSNCLQLSYRLIVFNRRASLSLCKS